MKGMREADDYRISFHLSAKTKHYISTQMLDYGDRLSTKRIFLATRGGESVDISV